MTFIATALKVGDAARNGTWQGLAQHSFYSSEEWLRVGELESDGRCGVVRVERDGAVVAAMPYWIADGWESPARRPDSVLARTGLRSGTYVVAGSPSAYWSELAVTPDTDPHEVAKSVVTAMRSIATDVGARGCLALYCEPATATALTSAARDAPPAVLLDGHARIEVPPDWTMYPESVSARRRQSVRREWRAFDAADYDVAVTPLAECVEEYLEVQAQLELAHDPMFDQSYLRRNVLAQLEVTDTAEVITVRSEGALVCASLFHEQNDAITVRAYGAVSALSRSPFDYFAATYYLPVRRAIEQGCRHVDVGISTLDAKVARGAFCEPLWAVDLSETPLWDEAGAQRATSCALEEQPALRRITGAEPRQ